MMIQKIYPRISTSQILSLSLILLFLSNLGSLQALNFSPAFQVGPATSSGPRIGLNDQGLGAVVWPALGNFGYQAYARLLQKNRWESTVQINNEPSYSSAATPVVSLSSTVTVMVAWTETWTGALFAKEYNGVDWGVATSINQNLLLQSSGQQLAMNGAGKAIIVWSEGIGGLTTCYARHFDGADWGYAFTLGAQLAVGPQVAINNSDRAWAVWQEGSPSSVYARYFDGTDWGYAFTLDQNETRTASSADIAMNETGSAMAVWLEGTSFSDNVCYARLFDGADWGYAFTLSQDVSQNANAPRVAMNLAGSAFAVWSEGGFSSSKCYVRQFDGVDWSYAFTLNFDTSKPAFNPQIAMNDWGKAVAVWSEGLFPSACFMREFDGLSWSQAYTMSSGSMVTASLPQIKINNNGTVLIAWASFDGVSASPVFARQTVLPYTFTQWCSAQNGTQYIAAGRSDATDSSVHIDMYSYDPATSNLEFKTSMTVTGTLDHFSVYNESATQFHLAAITHGPDSLTLFDFDGSSTALVHSYTMNLNDAQWWVYNGNPYIAALSNSQLSIIDVNATTTIAQMAASGSNLLWITDGTQTALVVLDGSTATPYSVDFGSGLVTAGTGTTAPEGFTYSALSTCEDYIAVGLTSTDTTTYGPAQVQILSYDFTTSALSYSGTSTTLAEGQIGATYLARCCCCATDRPLIVGSYDSNFNYTVSVFDADLAQLYASTLLGSHVSSVAWSCQGENNYLSASSTEPAGYLYAVKYTFTNNSLTDQTNITY